MYNIIKKPIITEKNSLMAENNVYVFEVEKSATKTEIRNAVSKLFDVKVKDVRTSVCRGRARRHRFGTTAVKYWKKAMVQLAPGEKISIFEGA